MFKPNMVFKKLENLYLSSTKHGFLSMLTQC